jgi:hypothetical protein
MRFPTPEFYPVGKIDLPQKKPGKKIGRAQK